MKLTTEREKTIQIPNDADNGFIKIKNLEIDEIWQIDQKTSTVEMDGKNEQRFSYDPSERENLKITACLTGWGNLFGEDGKELKFNRPNIRLSRRFIIINEVTGEKNRFFEWIDDERKKFAAEVEEEEAAAAGN